MFPYKLTAFDLDGTLTRSKTPITPEMAGLLQKLSETTKVAIISGGSIVQFEKQLLPFIKPSKNIIL
ncbi:MAG: HAD family hydrolase, partial [Patescibacteria group bacterium]